MEQRDDMVDVSPMYKQPSMYKDMVAEQLKQFVPNSKESHMGGSKDVKNEQKGP